ncbi:MAG: diversity-generating retroelement protein Avd [Candidatus Woesebacteria bacterium]|jgi:hypothetical protein
MDDLIVFRKMYEYLSWLRPSVERFARMHRYGLGNEMEQSALTVLRHIVSANFAADKLPAIGRALVELEVLRIYQRLTYDYKLLSGRQFTHASALLDEIGRLLRGWHKSYRGPR